MDINAEKKYFFEALSFFYETQWLHNVPVTEILTKASLDAIPKEWMEQLQILENEELNNFVVEKTIKSDWPDSLRTYVAKCKKINRLPPVPALSSVELPQNFKIGLSRKKQHEIMHLAHLVDVQCKRHNIQTIIDLGAGLGYICQMLHYLYDYQVLGLERDKKNISRAFTRQTKLYPDSLTKVKYTHCDVTCDSADAIESILRQEFSDITDVCLIGLHACGDLSTSASKIFCRMKSAKLFILISCCYHKLSISESISLQDKQYFHNFPISNCLRETIAAYNFDVGQFLRIPFLRLACQESADKWYGMSQEKHNEHSFHVLARAVLELYSRHNNYILNKKVRKSTRKSQCSNFQTYVKDSLLRYDLISDMKKTDSIITRDEMEKSIMRIWEEQSRRLKAVEIYTGLQMMLQLPAESLILQDRLCWLHEHGLEAVTVPVMNKTTLMHNVMKSFREVLANASNILILTGSGISAESGVPTFRGAGGFWRKYQAQNLATPEAFAANPSLVWEFYEYRRQLVSKVKPNKAHEAVADFQKRKTAEGKRVSIVTQNIDGLHQKAGATDVLELHGSLYRTRCTKCGNVAINENIPICPALVGKGSPDPSIMSSDIPTEELPRCEIKDCGALLRPDIIWFGEQLDANVLEKAFDIVETCDACLVIGTSAIVYPAAMFAPQIAQRNVPVAEFNIEETPATRQVQYHFQGPSSITVTEALAS